MYDEDDDETGPINRTGNALKTYPKEFVRVRENFQGQWKIIIRPNAAKEIAEDIMIICSMDRLGKISECEGLNVAEHEIEGSQRDTHLH